MKPASKKVNKLTSEEQDLEVLSYAERIERYALENGPRGSALVKAAALHRAISNLEEGELDDAQHLQTAKDLIAVWEKLPRGEREAMRNGWHDPGMEQTPRQWLRDQEGFCDNEIEWALDVSLWPNESEVVAWAGWHFFTGRTGLRVLVGAGSEREDIARQLRLIADGLEQRWPAMIANRGGMELVRWSVPAAPAARPADGLPIGTFVRDGDACGLVVAGAKGVAGWVYLFVEADGRMNCQFENGLTVGPGERRGLPPVVDLEGRDPLAELRGGGMPCMPTEEKSEPQSRVNAASKRGGKQPKSKAVAAAS
jgi:hypothetical protein